MDEKEMQELHELRHFSWTNLFLVTGLSFLVFSGLLTFLQGSHISFFFNIGAVATALGILGLINKWVSQKFIPVKSRQQEQGQ
jgi:hypothetical protein